MRCRYCREPLQYTFLDLGFSPPSNAYLSNEQLFKPELFYPLKVKVCVHCWLVQTEDYTKADELFGAEYAYLSSTSDSWLVHAKQYAEKIITDLGLTTTSHVIEVASNDGYLLKNFVANNIPCLGIEPTRSTAEVAESIGVPVLREFFGEAIAKRLASEGKKADLIIGNNVYAHVPDINDFTKGLCSLLKPNGIVTLEFPHLMRLIEDVQFDTIYHEHFSYLSLNTVCKIFTSAELRIWRVERLPTHGGSLRVYGCQVDNPRPTESSVDEVLRDEIKGGLQEIKTYLDFQTRADQIKNDLLAFLLQLKKENKFVVGYGAAAKGNTLLNYAGIKPDLLPLIYDGASSKQGKYTPGSHIPILSPEKIKKMKQPDYILILPWNIADEIKEKNFGLVADGVKFVTAIPKIVIS
jgi:SAM-dependent methyltransferase